MKKLFMTVALVLCLIMGFTTLTACNGEKDILVITRESGSGTRDAFDGLVKNADGATLAKKADGTAFDAIVKTADIQSSTGNVMTKVASVKSAIGYISLGSLNDTVRAVTVNNVSATAENVLNNTYKLQRPFVMMTKKDLALTEATADFIKYLESKQAQAIVTANKFVEQASAIDYVAPATAVVGDIVIKGSTSIDPLMDKLIANYKVKGGNKVTGVTFTKDAQGSSQGISATKADTTGNVIGMSSSNIKDADKPSLDYFNVALDAVAVVVNKTNAISNLSIPQLYDIYTGAIAKFTAIK